ncbi:hypothetical protein [Pontibacter sp. G13]|uniref:TolB family protein n=1 Tax=Pontibacter sp. G13 TaxID=3074898 RepID=UPI00288A6002|nr:hypothetical protein [Pontibacter sp. G13]WNJ16824.1 hypothetical protein RJD25_18325 [Pontibacter sp. G13]
MRKLLWIVLIMGQVYAQGSTDLVVLNLSLSPEGAQVSNPVRVTDRAGYDNQPSFTPNGKALLFSSIREGEQADAYRYNLKNGKLTNLTQTPTTSEFSPTVMPDGKHISVVMVEEDSSQRLWQFGIKGGNGKRLTPGIDQIGYHAWLDVNQLTFFILPGPFTLQLGDLSNQSTRVLDTGIGRSIHIEPLSGHISYVLKTSDTQWEIYTIDPKSGEKHLIVETLEGQEDYVWAPDGSLLMGKDTELFQFRPGVDVNWRKVGDLNVGRFYRLAVSPKGDKLAVVVYRNDTE